MVSAGRLPVVAGIIANSTAETPRRGRQVAELGVVAPQVTPPHYLFRPDDDAMVGHFRTLTEETGLPVSVAEDPLSSVVLGTGKMLSNLDLLRKISLD